MPKPLCYFDPQDYALMNLVQGFVAARAEHRTGPQLDASLHPHGIIEIGSSYSMRIAHSLITLLDSLSAGGKEHRLQALQRLHDEVLNSARSPFRHNTGRVLIQIMKDLVRSKSREQSLMLAHDFHKAAQGTPRVVRHLLSRYHLLEMPEEWNQQAFDHHVHDGNTKGRKNPTHLVMDAWIKGLRFLTVIYYNRVTTDGMEELLLAAQIMEIRVRVGIEFRAAYHDSFVDIIWSPLDCYDPEHFYAIMEQPAFQSLMDDYQPVSRWMYRHTLQLLAAWNSTQSKEFARTMGIPCPAPVSREAFLNFVGHRLPMSLHFAEFIFRSLEETRTEEIKKLEAGVRKAASPEEKMALEQRLTAWKELLPDTIIDTWLSPAANPGIVFPYKPDPGMPEIMLRPPEVLITRLAALPPSQIILNLASLTAADALELLWRGGGHITHLELFNLREWMSGRLAHLEEINELQRALNEGSAPELKHVVQNIVAADVLENPLAAPLRRPLFENILRHITEFQRMYAGTPLGSRLGTDSTSRSHHTYGMGLAFVETLPYRAQNIVRKSSHRHLVLPITTDIYRFVRIHEPDSPVHIFSRLLRCLPFASQLGMRTEQGWGLEARTTRVGRAGNLVTLGGVNERGLINREDLTPTSLKSLPFHNRLNYLNSHLVNTLKVLTGFLPAQWAFWYTDSWWFLILYGALLWFFITGVRNIGQFILSGGGLSRNVLLPWKRFISWNRIADSLMYTGISVVLLEVLIRSWLLEGLLGLTVREDAVLVYGTISLVNGLYISLHNIFRGFPRQAIIGNLFRSVFAIPVTVVFGEGVFSIFSLTGAADPMALTQNCAAITSKCASDTVAAAIEGFADRNQYLRRRRWDYASKLRQVFSNFSRQELLFAHRNIGDYYHCPGVLWKMLQKKDPKVAREAVVNMLDMLYFWYYLPRARQVFRQILGQLSETERQVVLGMHNILSLEREVCHIILNGLVGKDFSKALAFYLVHHGLYLKALAPYVQVQPRSPTSLKKRISPGRGWR